MFRDKTPAKPYPPVPPVYRPHLPPRAMQPKVDGPGAQAKPPTVPPIYRPAPAIVSQPKVATAARRPSVPPVYRPLRSGVSQPKMATQPSGLKRPAVPPVYRPQRIQGAVQRHGGVMQRVVINLDPGDTAITQSALIHKKRDDAFARKDTLLITGDVSSSAAAPLSSIDADEEITILAHGTPAMGGDVPRVAGKTAQELYDHLVKMGFTRHHTGLINLSNCTSAWDRKKTGSFADQFVKILMRNGHENYVTGYESFTESASDTEELEVPAAKREVFLAHKVTERYISKLMTLFPKDAVENKGAVLKSAHAELKAGARQAFAESADFKRESDDVSKGLATFYESLANRLMTYLATVGDAYSERAIVAFQEDAMSLMKAFGFDNLGARLHNQKVEAIPVLTGGAFSRT